MFDKFFACCFRLEEADIHELDKADNGPINNVTVGLAKHCYGVNLADDQLGFLAKIYYINGAVELKGDIIELDPCDPDYFELLMRFCMMLANDYKEADAIDAFNTFQTKLRGFLEKLGFQTVTGQELEQSKGQNQVMFSHAKRGLFKMTFIEKKEFYRDFFCNNHNCEIDKTKQYI